MTYTWANLLDLVREARRHRDLEVRSAVLADICQALDYLLAQKDCSRCGLLHQGDCPEWTVPQ